MPTRRALAESALRAVVAAGYENLGTLEFLVDADGNYYFIEINCRIQVEHPVTEMLSGIDLVAEQIRIAAGEPLGYSQADVVLRGHAIEFRINAEDVRHDFRPQAGLVERYLPPGGPGVRMDSHMYGGYEVPPYYDSLLGQARRLGPRPADGDRPLAPRRLDELVLDGLTTNVEFHRALIVNPTFLQGAFTTNLLDRVGRGGLPGRGCRLSGPSNRAIEGPMTETTQTVPAAGSEPATSPEPAARATTAGPAASGPLLTTSQIQGLIPHRWPFLLVDRIVEEDRERGYIRGEKAVTATEWFFQGHFPGLPVMPGVLQVEALAQTMAVYVARQEGFGTRIGLFAAIDECRFKRIVQPGDRLTLEVTMEKLGRRMGRGRAVASVDGEVACEALLSFIIPPEGALR